MAKSIVIYYSLEGNTDYIAHAVAEGAGAQLLRLHQQKEIAPTGLMRFVTGGKLIATKGLPPLAEEMPDLSDVEYVFLGTPVWASTFAPALRTFLSQDQLAGKKVACFMCYAGNAGRVEQDLKQMCPEAEFVGSIGFRDPYKKKKSENLSNAREWAAGILGKLNAE
jgi:flavodoxin